MLVVDYEQRVRCEYANPSKQIKTHTFYENNHYRLHSHGAPLK